MHGAASCASAPRSRDVRVQGREHLLDHRSRSHGKGATRVRDGRDRGRDRPDRGDVAWGAGAPAAELRPTARRARTCAHAPVAACASWPWGRRAPPAAPRDWASRERGGRPERVAYGRTWSAGGGCARATFLSCDDCVGCGVPDPAAETDGMGLLVGGVPPPGRRRIGLRCTLALITCAALVVG
jgi:hypothetical protein